MAPVKSAVDPVITPATDLTTNIGIHSRKSVVAAHARSERACQEFQGKEIPSAAIGEQIMRELQTLDGVAYVRFASVYREFRDVSDFLTELKDLLHTKKDGGGEKLEG